MDVPNPMDKIIPILLSFLDMTANPIICVVQPITDAPPATPSRLIAMAIAAEDSGDVSNIPMTAAIIIDMTIGTASVEIWTKS